MTCCNPTCHQLNCCPPRMVIALTMKSHPRGTPSSHVAVPNPPPHPTKLF